MSAHHHLYNTTRWRKLRAAHLAGEPLCVMCNARGQLTPANTCDHVRPHRGDMTLFLDPANLQSLCAPCHSSTKQAHEWSDGNVVPVDIDGYPVNGSW
jgi:5-methylcytosine-specific restriction endonuclease McrA